MEDKDILDVIQGLVAEEQWVHGQQEKGALDPASATARLREIRGRLDEMWTTLRRRRALRAAGTDPQDIELRGPGVIAS